MVDQPEQKPLIHGGTPGTGGTRPWVSEGPKGQGTGIKGDIPGRTPLHTEVSKSSHAPEGSV